MKKTTDIRIRDPYIVAKNGTYYLYSSSVKEFSNSVCVYKSTDLTNWQEPIPVYTLDTSGWKDYDLWASEVHEYNDKYYLFVSIMGKSGLRGTEISVSDTPDGTFTPIANRPATPLDKSCIDGTLFVDGDTPYIVYSRDWPDNYITEIGAYVGQICACELSKDLTTPVGEPFLLFNSNDCPYSAQAASPTPWEGKNVLRYGSDAPFIQRLSNGKLFLTWSPIPANNYVVLGATADNIRGPWTHIEPPLYDNNGGHAMFFTDFDGTKKMCIHQPEKFTQERALIIQVHEKDGRITRK